MSNEPFCRSFANLRLQRLGGAEKIDPDEALKAAAKAAADADVVIAVVGLNHEWESEGFDRPTLSMPGRQDELIKTVSKANKNTVVVIQAVSELVQSLNRGLMRIRARP